MKQIAFTLGLAALAAVSARAQTNPAYLDHEHCELRMQYDAAASNKLAIALLDTDRDIFHASNEVVLVVKTQAMTTLPAGTPFGNAGEKIWILPQSQNPNILYLGPSAANIPAGVFGSTLDLTLKSVRGPGNFFAWVAAGPGQFDVKMNTRDGLTAADKIPVPTGSHAHYNFGFGTNGIYCVTFQAGGTRVGEAQPITGFETTFIFHVLPLPVPTNFPAWQKTFFPPWIAPALTATNADPDGDRIPNLLEYAFHLNPNISNAVTEMPRFSFVTNSAQRYGALGFTRSLAARDLTFWPEATGVLSGGWVPLTNLFSTVSGPSNLTERVTFRDSLPANTMPRRFHRLRVGLK